MAGGSIHCLSVPLGYQLWDKKQTKLEIAAEMVRSAMEGIGQGRQVFLLCDSWYPKGCAAGLVDEFPNLDIICNARIDSVMYGLLHQNVQGNADTQRNMADACHRKILALNPQKPGIGR